jgi:hypothetical protein
MLMILGDLKVGDMAINNSFAVTKGALAHLVAALTFNFSISSAFIAIVVHGFRKK